MNAALTLLQIRTRTRAHLARAEQILRRSDTRGPQRPVAFELLLELRTDGHLYIRPRGAR